MRFKLLKLKLNSKPTLILLLLSFVAGCGDNEKADTDAAVLPADSGPVRDSGTLLDGGNPTDGGPVGDGSTSLPPTVISTTPADGAPGVSINHRPTATFSEPMDVLSLNTVTFLLKQGATAIAGHVMLDAATNTATFTPDAPLTVGLSYTATITTGARDSGGTGLVADHVWSFTTAACSQPPITLYSAANFAILAGATITNTGLTVVTGDMGVSPGTAITGFFPPGTVVGAQHSADGAAGQGIADLLTAYNETALRVLCPVSKIGNLGGMTLKPGLYKSTSTMSISSGDLTLDGDGDRDAIFVFQMVSSLDTSPGRKMLLINGARAANIYWQVGSDATLETTSVFFGTIMADQSIRLRTGASLTGRALARIGEVTLDTNAVNKPAP
jgi:Ice-binding-like/Bacterial Ig-like domain